MSAPASSGKRAANVRALGSSGTAIKTSRSDQPTITSPWSLIWEAISRAAFLSRQRMRTYLEGRNCQCFVATGFLRWLPKFEILVPALHVCLDRLGEEWIEKGVQLGLRPTRFRFTFAR